jgi:diaminohydroxyphosphoribosylaminopyrimidine deaminase/5-amino-6-(5-phosphoribosylamino)uracil reductase
LIKDGTIVGQGWHEKTGEAHAEINALKDAGDAAQGATAYVTLEPCCHQGKTSPCSSALIAAGVVSVLCAMEDPNPKVAGQGIAALRDADMEVRVGLMKAQAEHLNRGFIKRMRFSQPFVRLKMAASLDGATAMRNGESQWITGDAARLDVQRLRAESGAIMTGIGTVLADDPALTVRDSELAAEQPLRVIIDSQLRMPATARMLALAGETAVACMTDKGGEVLSKAGASIICCPGENGRVDLSLVLQTLAQQGINDVLVEAGPTLAGALIDANLVDELVIYQAPHIMGSETRGMFDTPSWTTLADRLELVVTDVRRIGVDTRLTMTPKQRTPGS